MPCARRVRYSSSEECSSESDIKLIPQRRERHPDARGRVAVGGKKERTIKGIKEHTQNT